MPSEHAPRTLPNMEGVVSKISQDSLHGKPQVQDKWILIFRKLANHKNKTKQNKKQTRTNTNGQRDRQEDIILRSLKPDQWCRRLMVCLKFAKQAKEAPSCRADWELSVLERRGMMIYSGSPVNILTAHIFIIFSSKEGMRVVLLN